MERDTERVERLVRACLGDWTVAGMERLGGMTNRSYHVTARRRADGAVQELAVRLPGPGTGQTQRRSDEARSMALACELGIDADLYYFAQRTGEKVAAFLPDVQTLHPADLRRVELLEGIARVLARLHRCGRTLEARFDPPALADAYAGLIREDGGWLPEGYEAMRARAGELYAGRMARAALAPCHNDPLSENWLLQAGGRLYLIDWEYAGMNDPLWDLAAVALEAELPPALEQRLLAAYFGRPATREERQGVLANQVLMDYLWGLWGVMRAPWEGEALARYARSRWSRMQANLRRLPGG